MRTVPPAASDQPISRSVQSATSGAERLLGLASMAAL